MPSGPTMHLSDMSFHSVILWDKVSQLYWRFLKAFQAMLLTFCQKTDGMEWSSSFCFNLIYQLHWCLTIVPTYIKLKCTNQQQSLGAHMSKMPNQHGNMINIAVRHIVIQWLVIHKTKLWCHNELCWPNILNCQKAYHYHSMHSQDLFPHGLI